MSQRLLISEWSNITDQLTGMEFSLSLSQERQLTPPSTLGREDNPPPLPIRKASLFARWGKRDAEEQVILKTVSLGGAWQDATKVRILNTWVLKTCQIETMTQEFCFSQVSEMTQKICFSQVNGLTLGSDTSSAQNKSLRPLLNRIIPPRAPARTPSIVSRKI